MRPIPRRFATSAQAERPVVILVHGAFADGSGWQHVIPMLEKDGYTVIAVQNALASLDADVAWTKRVIDAQKGPVVLVGHSYGGAVITGAAAGSANVKALVYLNAFAPDSGEPVGALNDKYPAPLGAALRPDAAGFFLYRSSQFSLGILRGCARWGSTYYGRCAEAAERRRLRHSPFPSRPGRRSPPGMLSARKITP